MPRILRAYRPQYGFAGSPILALLTDPWAARAAKANSLLSADFFRGHLPSLSERRRKFCDILGA
jgi:hypothetical protein